MTEHRDRPERIDLAQADDPRDVVHRAVACLAQGGAVGLTIDGDACVAAGALHPEAVARASNFAGPDAGRRPALLLRGDEEAVDWSPGLPDAGRRLGRRGWPGPLTLVVPCPDDGLAARLPEAVRRALAPDGRLALRVPTSGLALDVARLVPGPIVAFEVAARRGAGSPWGGSRPDVASLDMVIEAAGSPSGLPATSVRVDADGWAVERAGAIPEADIAAMAGRVWLFVCTGNTCRSPMAEALCKAMLAKRLGCAVGALADRGYVVLSAGVGASDGMPAASHAVEIVAARGGALKSHASRRATPDLIRGADLIVAMAGEHLDVVLDLVPEAAERARLLHAEGLDVADPIGSDRATYEATAREIERHLARMIGEQGL